MQLDQLVTPIEELTDEELMERLRELRHRRSVLRPAAKRHKEKAVKKGSQGKISKAAKLAAGLTEEQKAILIKQLGG